MKASLRRQINNALHDGIPSFGKSIPLGKMFNFVNLAGFVAIQEDGEPWQGLLCGHSGSASIQLKDISTGEVQRECLQVQWWGEDVHGRPGTVETNCYVL